MADDMTDEFRIPIQVLVNPVAQTPAGRRYLLLRRVPSSGGYWQGVSGAPWKNEMHSAGAHSKRLAVSSTGRRTSKRCDDVNSF